MKKQHKGILALRIVVLVVPVLVWAGASLISDYAQKSCEWLSKKLPSPWR